MKPEILQTISQIIIVVGVILAGGGGFGAYYYGNKISQKREISTDKKLDNIPRSIISVSKENRDAVLKAIENVKLSIDEIAATDGSHIKKISYQKGGEFGTNILNRNIIKYKIGTHSMRVEIPKNQYVIVKISGKNWGFPVFQPIPGWEHYDYKKDGDKITRKFKSIKAGILDLKMYLTGKGEIVLSVFENEIGRAHV